MIVCLDFETFYSKEYSLTRMSTAEYILDPRFEVLMVSLQIDDGPVQTYEGPQVKMALASVGGGLDWTKAAMCSHNARFDASILAWHYNITPKLYLDTLAMARALVFPHTGRASLAAVARFFGFPEKGTAVENALGKRRGDFTDAGWAAYKDYCAHDTVLCRMVLDRLGPRFAKSELRLMDTTVRMFVEPQVTFAAPILASHLAQVRDERRRIMEKIMPIEPETLASNYKFGMLLRSMGVEPPVKISPRTGKETWALAKNDREFKELCTDDQLPLTVQAVLMARLNVKSTLEETRTEALLRLANLRWPGQGSPVSWAPVPLRYYGAHTGRFSGDDGFNWQNFTRGSKIRAAIVAPDGWVIVHRDASQIEARMVAWMAGCTAQLEAFRDPKRDLYCEFASRLYRRSVTKSDPLERFTGKTGILSLGYGCGHKRFRHTLFIGAGGGAVSVVIDEPEAARIVDLYRETYPEIPQLWRRGDAVLTALLGKGSRERWATTEYRPVKVDVDGKQILLPNGMPLQYVGLEEKKFIRAGKAVETLGCVYRDPHVGPDGFGKFIYGGKLLENVSQALCRIIVTDIIDRVALRTGYRPFLMTHDSLDYCVPAAIAEDFDAMLEAEFAQRPAWAADLPLASEGGWGRSLAAAEKKENKL